MLAGDAETGATASAGGVGVGVDRVALGILSRISVPDSAHEF